MISLSNWLLLLLQFKEAVDPLTKPKRPIQGPKINQKNYESKLKGTVTYSNSLTVPSMQQSRMQGYRIGHNSSKRKPI